jgi:hypothetical protein
VTVIVEDHPGPELDSAGCPSVGLEDLLYVDEGVALEPTS